MAQISWSMPPNINLTDGVETHSHKKETFSICFERVSFFYKIKWDELSFSLLRYYDTQNSILRNESASYTFYNKRSFIKVLKSRESNTFSKCEEVAAQHSVKFFASFYRANQFETGDEIVIKYFVVIIRKKISVSQQLLISKVCFICSKRFLTWKKRRSHGENWILRVRNVLKWKNEAFLPQKEGKEGWMEKMMLRIGKTTEKQSSSIPRKEIKNDDCRIKHGEWQFWHKNMPLFT